MVVLRSGSDRPYVSLVADVGALPHGTKDNRRKLLLFVIAFGFVFFSAATNKLPGYLLPLLPSVAAIAGVRLTEVPRRSTWYSGSFRGLLIAVPLVRGNPPEALARGLGPSGYHGNELARILPMTAAAGLVSGWPIENSASMRSQ